MSTSTSIRRAVNYALLSGASAAAMVLPAQAQEDAQITEVIVTGSRIPQPNLTSISPVTAVTSEQIKIEGVVRVEDLINNLPQAFADFGGNLSNGATGTATVNLRNLGSERTLVLINGRRLMPGDPTQNGAASPDLNQIPSALIERVEVLSGGASAVYGADAVAGVVNFIMNDNFEGIRVDAQYGFYQHENDSNVQSAVRARNFGLPSSNVTDGNSKEITFLAGINTPDGRGNATVYLGYRELDALKQDQRDFSSCALGSGYDGDPFTCAGSGTTAPAHFGPNILGPDGNLRPYVAARDAYNFAPDNYYQRPDERKTAGLFAHYDFSDAASVYTEFMFMDDRTTAQIAASGAFAGGGPGQPPFFGNQLFNCDNPYFNQSMLDAWCGGSASAGDVFVPLARRNVEGGGRIDDLRHTSFRGVLGVRGDFATAWNYDVYALYGETLLSENYQNDFSRSRLGKALNAVRDAQGNIVCRVNADVDLSNDDPACVPYNIFQLGGVTPEQLAYLQIPGFSSGGTTEQILSGSVAADLGHYGIKLPTANDGLGFAIGAEYRSERSELRADAAYQTNDLAGQGAPTLDTTGSFDVREIFTELRLPILQDKPFAQTLSAEAGYRFSDYNLGFDTDTYKLGLDWAPVEDIRFRASYQRAVRSPNIQELFLQPRVQLNGNTDPCAGANPSRTLEECALTGVTPEQYGNIVANPAAQYNGLVGGNPNLDPEESDTYSYGLVFTPSFLPSFTMTLDYFDIKVEKLIDQIGQDFILNQCMDSGDPEFCNRINRIQAPGTEGNGSLWLGDSAFVEDPILNTGSLSTKGVDLEMNYRLEAGGAGAIAFSLVGTYTDEFVTEPLAGFATKYDCKGLYGTVCGVPIPEWRQKVRANWLSPWGVDVALTWRYIDEVSLDLTSSDPDLNDDDFATTDARLGSRSYFDLSASYTFQELGAFSSVTGRLGINNLTDKDPPLLGQDNCPAVLCNGNTFPQVYDTLGRFIFVGLTADF
ncbi:TonB-dependent receptor [Steroidobacter sp. S1-65]|uniref:TonB-dependent receptor n=1 Tax=Steroidobacter gossypii TaxID=2805490 RepID=A0ABS1WRC0_9GAMM|nr:TonB-dependent receptor [Steroidobacter gossypii]MBM0103525.1 TonB-dependent receptor [Steroidobacter gossypii]